MASDNQFDIDTLTKIYTKPAESTSIIRAEMTQRAAIISKWNIFPAARILEIGCGQGDCTLVLAEAVGANGHITGLDPAPLTYGSPYTLGEAQAHLKSSIYGDRIDFIQADPRDFLAESHPQDGSARANYTYDFAVFCHSIWYFDAPSYLSSMLQLLRGVAKVVCIAEYNLDSADPETLPHLLAALSQSQLASNQPKGSSLSNIRSLMSSRGVLHMATQAGWQVAGNEAQLVRHPPDLLEGKWEVATVVSEDYRRSIEMIEHEDERKGAVLRATRDACAAAAERIEAERGSLRTMDSWVASLICEDS